jgi:hypothetical protein
MGKKVKLPTPKASTPVDNKLKKGNPNDETNRPRNHLITDATHPVGFTFTRFGSKHTVTVQQTAAEDTWPGGALWDLGVLLSQVLVEWTRGASLPLKKSTCPS